MKRDINIYIYKYFHILCRFKSRFKKPRGFAIALKACETWSCRHTTHHAIYNLGIWCE